MVAIAAEYNELSPHHDTRMAVSRCRSLAPDVAVTLRILRGYSIEIEVVSTTWGGLEVLGALFHG